MRELYRQAYREAARVIVAGGRDFDDYVFMKKELDRLFWGEDFCGNGQIKILSGMAPGADTLAIRYADEYDLTKILFPANWNAIPAWRAFCATRTWWHWPPTWSPFGMGGRMARSTSLIWPVRKACLAR